MPQDPHVRRCSPANLHDALRRCATLISLTGPIAHLPRQRGLPLSRFKSDGGPSCGEHEVSNTPRSSISIHRICCRPGWARARVLHLYATAPRARLGTSALQGAARRPLPVCPPLPLLPVVDGSKCNGGEGGRGIVAAAKKVLAVLASALSFPAHASTASTPKTKSRGVLAVVAVLAVLASAASACLRSTMMETNVDFSWNSISKPIEPGRRPSSHRMILSMSVPIPWISPSNHHSQRGPRLKRSDCSMESFLTPLLFFAGPLQ